MELFWVSSVVFAVASAISVVVHLDSCNVVGISMAIMHGICCPYLRYLTSKKNVRGNSVGYSFIVGLLLALIAAILSLLMDAFVSGS